MADYSDEQANAIGTIDENQTQKCIPAPTSQSSSGGDKSQLTTDVDALLGIGWALDKEQMGVQRTFYFADPANCQVGIIQIFTACAESFAGFLYYHCNTK
ncbi:hypothetical protein B0O99DRAFT_641230 [Bisporella sp. PMI_857]|nr:hypothetical protein B0O99DRAFT_641230 [Bisporella sp. PMI_857]